MLAANASKSLAAAYSERLTMSEAVEAVGRMLAAFPNTRDGVRDGYLGVMAQLLTRYPRQTALRCAHPIDGVIRDCKFLPTVSEAVKWLEREQLPLLNANVRERRDAEQFAQRERDEADADREPLEHRQDVAARIKDELRAKGFMFAGDSPGANTVAKEREKLLSLGKITPEQFLSIPDAPKSSDCWQGVRSPNP